MSVLGYRARNHPQQTASRGALDEVDDRGTDPAFVAELAIRFGDFTLDVAAAPHNAKCERFYTRADNGLEQPWPGRIWANPPYSHPNLNLWLRKAWAEWNAGRPELIVGSAGQPIEGRVLARKAAVRQGRPDAHRTQRTASVRVLPADLGADWATGVLG